VIRETLKALQRCGLAAILTILLPLCFGTAAAQEVQNVHPLQGVTFKRQSLGSGTYNAWRVDQYSYGSAVLPAWPGPVAGRGYVAHVMGTPRAPGTSVMWGTWTFMSRGLFTSAPGAHVGFVMRGLTTGLSNVGMGFVVGGLSGFSSSDGGACAAGARSQPETWHELSDGTAGNRLIGGSQCGPLMHDWRPYNVTLHAAADGYSYSITDATTGVQVFSTYVSNAGSPSASKIALASGWTAGIVFADVPGASWEFEVSNIALGWF